MNYLLQDSIVRRIIWAGVVGCLKPSMAVVLDDDGANWIELGRIESDMFGSG